MTKCHLMLLSLALATFPFKGHADFVVCSKIDPLEDPPTPYFINGHIEFMKNAEGIKDIKKLCKKWKYGKALYTHRGVVYSEDQAKEIARDYVRLGPGHFEGVDPEFEATQGPKMYFELSLNSKIPLEL